MKVTPTVDGATAITGWEFGLLLSNDGLLARVSVTWLAVPVCTVPSLMTAEVVDVAPLPP